MTTDRIISLVVSILALVTSITTFTINLCRQNLADKKRKRVYPVISLLDKTDNIVERAKTTPNAKVYCEKPINFNNVNLCVIIKNSDIYKLVNCSVAITLGDRTESFAVGLLTDKRPLIFPFTTEEPERISCVIEYLTEENEQIRYIANADANFANRHDEVCLLRKYRKPKKLKILNKGLSNSYSIQEIFNDKV